MASPPPRMSTAPILLTLGLPAELSPVSPQPATGTRQGKKPTSSLQILLSLAVTMIINYYPAHYVLQSLYNHNWDYNFKISCNNLFTLTTTDACLPVTR